MKAKIEKILLKLVRQAMQYALEKNKKYSDKTVEPEADKILSLFEKFLDEQKSMINIQIKTLKPECFVDYVIQSIKNKLRGKE
jgi:DNA-binding transcriptional MerR regulator